MVVCSVVVGSLVVSCPRVSVNFIEISYLSVMLEIIFQGIAEAFSMVFSEWLFGGTARLFRKTGLRAYSLFNGEWSVPIKELREKHDDKMIPWFLAAFIWGGVLYWFFAWTIG